MKKKKGKVKDVLVSERGRVIENADEYPSTDALHDKLMSIAEDMNAIGDQVRSASHPRPVVHPRSPPNNLCGKPLF